jgi:hypothetical protein
MNSSSVGVSSEELTNPGAVSLFRQFAVDAELRELRTEFRNTAVDALESVSSWLAFDAFLAGGDVPNEGGGGSADADRFHAFHAVAAVAQMASELAHGASLLADSGRIYASASLTRQLLECEYHLTHFSTDFGAAASWALAAPSDMRKLFAPGQLRKVEGFADKEYWSHCDSGGHPSPAGRHLLRHDVRSAPDREFVEDLTQHVYRAWKSLDAVLVAEHARYASVQARDRASVSEVRQRWVEADPIALGPNFGLLKQLATDTKDVP